MPFPADAYTPHGYLDMPTHTRNLSPRGVLRSWEAGFRWHAPAYAGMYGGRRETYRAGFQLALDGISSLARFDRATSPYHSKNIFSFDLAHGAASCQATFFTAGDHALCTTIEASGDVRLALLCDYTRLLSASGEWGESGLVGRVVELGERGDSGWGHALVLQGFEDGEAFALWVSSPPSDLGVTTDPPVASGWLATPGPGLPPDGFVTALGRRGETVALQAALGFATPPERLVAVLARGRTLPDALRHLREARTTLEAERRRKLEEDARFWQNAPRLEGDWPDHWRRGLVYDLETLRMMVKQPAGIYRQIWDAMQIQAPRVVLAEAAIDALLLGYADPRLAQELLLGTFLDAPEPNVPCSREDGSYNMVAADGTVCGTAPEWGYPWLVLAWLYEALPNREWLARIYPSLAAYLGWWLQNRRDAEGWLVYACSWEAGQDDSPRFGAQPLGGGHPVRHVRPVDLQAAFAHACAVMSGFAQGLGRAEDREHWEGLAAEFRGRTERLWVAESQDAESAEWSAPASGRYADFDAHAGAPTTVDDVMLLAPLALGLATPERAAALRRAIAALDPDSLTWPMFVWTAVEAAQAAGLHERAAELAFAVVERAYRFWDAPLAHPERTLPGVACEYWPPSGRCGGEGYGWGAFTTHLLLHTLLGLSPDEGGLLIRPNLPGAWRAPGRSYRATVSWRERAIAVALEPLEEGRVAVRAGAWSGICGWGEQALVRWSEL